MQKIKNEREGKQQVIKRKQIKFINELQSQYHEEQEEKKKQLSRQEQMMKMLEEEERRLVEKLQDTMQQE